MEAFLFSRLEEDRRESQRGTYEFVLTAACESLHKISKLIGPMLSQPRQRPDNLPSEQRSGARLTDV